MGLQLREAISRENGGVVSSSMMTLWIKLCWNHPEVRQWSQAWGGVGCGVLGVRHLSPGPRGSGLQVGGTCYSVGCGVTEACELGTSLGPSAHGAPRGEALETGS